jgi:hypothetical protein
MRDFFWVLRHFGLFAAVRLAWDSLVRLFRRTLNRISRKRFPIRFEDLTDHDAEMTAWMAGVPNWQMLSREELNQAWNKFFQGKTVH